MTDQRLDGMSEVVGLPDQSHPHGHLEAGPGPISCQDFGWLAPTAAPLPFRIFRTAP